MKPRTSPRTTPLRGMGLSTAPQRYDTPRGQRGVKKERTLYEGPEKALEKGTALLPTREQSILQRNSTISSHQTTKEAGQHTTRRPGSTNKGDRGTGPQSRTKRPRQQRTGLIRRKAARTTRERAATRKRDQERPRRGVPTKRRNNARGNREKGVPHTRPPTPIRKKNRSVRNERDNRTSNKRKHNQPTNASNTRAKRRHPTGTKPRAPHHQRKTRGRGRPRQRDADSGRRGGTTKEEPVPQPPHRTYCA